MADNVEVKLGADAGPLKSGMTEAQRSVDSSLTSISNSLKNLTENSKAASDKAAASFDRLNSSVRHVAETFATYFGIRESIKQVLDEEAAVRGLEIAFGMTAERASQFGVQLRLAGVSAESFEQMSFRVGRVLKTQGDEFDRLKVTTKDAAGNLLPMDQILQNIYKRMQDFKAGTDQTEFALSTVGRNAKDFASDMERLSRTQERANQLIAAWGIEMGPDKQSRIENYRIEVNAFRVGMEEIAQRIGEALMPQLEGLAHYFAERGPAAAKIFATALTNIVATLDYVATAADKAQRRWEANNETKLADQRFFNNAWKALTEGGLDAVVKLWDDRAKELKAIELRKNADILGMEADFLKRMGKLGGEETTPGAKLPIPGSGTERFRAKPDTSGAESLVGQWRHELDVMRDAEDAFHEVSKAREAAFWESKLELARKGGEKVYNEVYHLMIEARKGAAREEFADQMASYTEQITAAKNNRDQQLALVAQRTEYVKSKYGEESKEFSRAMTEQIAARQAWAVKDQQIVAIETKMVEARAEFDAKMELLAGQQRVALRQESNQQLFALEQQLEDRTFAIKQAGIQRKLEAEKAGPNDPVKVAQINAELETLELDHQEKITAIVNAAQLDREQYALAADQAVESSFASLLNDLEGGTKSWKDAMTDAIKSITKELNNLAAQQFAKQVFGGGSTGGGMLNSLMSSIFGGGGAGAGFDMGSILSGFGVPLFAAGTAYVPQDTLAVVHRGEAVIPAQYNQRGALGQSFSVANHFAISGPIDTRTQDQIAAAAARGVQRAMQRNL